MSKTSADYASRIKRRRAFLGAAFGNGIEWYDFAVYGFLAVYIGRTFFASESQVAELLSTFAVFGLSFFARPVGALFFGPLADRIGRKRVMVIVLTVMAGSTFLIGLVPGYTTIGAWAPVLLVSLRLLQGFSAGGEFGSVSTFMTESAQPHRRGFGVSWMAFSCVLGIMLGGILSTALSAGLGEAAMHDWGWRIPFLIAGPLGLVGLFIRLKLEDTPEFTSIAAKGQTVDSPLRRVLKQPRPLLLAGGIAILYGVSFYMVFTYMTTYIRTVAKLGTGVALGSVLLGGIVALILLPVTGALSDRLGRKPVLLFSAVGYLAMSYPMFSLIAHGGTAGALTGTVVLAALQATYLATSIVTVTELFPAGIRTTGVSLGVNIPVALFGGTAPFAATFLLSSTGVDTSPSIYLMFAAAISVIALLVLSPNDLHRDSVAEADVHEDRSPLVPAEPSLPGGRRAGSGRFTPRPRG